MTNNGTNTTTTAITTQDYGITPSEPRPRTLDRLAFEPRDISELGTFADMVARSGLAPRSLKTPAAVALVVIQGRELNLTSCAALQGLIAVNGAISFRSRFAAQMVLRSSACELWQVQETRDMIGAVKVKRKEWDKPQTVEYTEEDAKRAGLWNSSDVWKKHPKDMLIARAITRAVNRHFPEVLGGISIDQDQQDAAAAGEVTPAAPAKPKNGKGTAALKEAIEVIVNEPEPEPEPVIAAPPEEGPTREAATEDWKTLQGELVDLIGEEQAAQRCSEITIDKKRSPKGRQKALDQLRAIIEEVKAAGI